ncbi:nuclease, partial [bacterium]|nr:nuclease [bacterium]
EPEPEPEPEPEGMYVGSINSDKYHYPWCYWAGQINPENEIWFTSKSDAESKGYVACKVCKP